MTTAFVLGGARNLGALQVGMLKALAEAGVVPDLVVGCSVGALNGVAVAADPSVAGIARLERAWLGLDHRDVWGRGRVASAVRLLRPGASVVGNDALRRVVGEIVPPTFEELRLPFHCVATALDTGEERWFDAGPLADPVLASCALPGLLPPVQLDGRPHVDGAVVNTVPLGKAVELGADHLVVLQVKDLEARPPAPRRPLDVVLRAVAISRNARFLAELAAVPDSVRVEVLPVIEVPRFRLDGGRTAELIEASRVATAAHLRRSP